MLLRHATLRALTWAVVLLAGCGDGPTDPIACTEIFVYGLVVDVRNGATGQPEAEGAVGVAVEGDYEETLMVFPALPPDRPLTMVGAGERPGSYDITVTKPGFFPWAASDVTVTADECHVRPVKLQANLIPEP